MRIETGYGLEGALPDATAHRIIDERITPAFRNNDYAGGLEAGIDAMMAPPAANTRPRPRPRRRAPPAVRVFVLPRPLVLFIVIAMSRSGRRGTHSTGGAAITAPGPGGGVVAGVRGGGEAGDWFWRGGFGGAGGILGRWRLVRRRRARPGAGEAHMQTKSFSAPWTTNAIVKAIRDAEARSRGEVRVHVSPESWSRIREPPAGRAPFSRRSA
jgi:hypothetical protein